MHCTCNGFINEDCQKKTKKTESVLDSSAEDAWWIGLTDEKVEGVWTWHGTNDVTTFTGNIDV